MRTINHPGSVQPVMPHRPGRAPRTAFVIASGASLGAMQVGRLRALYERAIDPDLLVGTSAGALSVAYIASRPHPTAEELGRVWREPHRVDIFPINRRAVISPLTSQRDHLVRDSSMRRLVVRYLQIERLEHASVALHLVAFDLLSGEEVRLSDGPAMDAVLAACDPRDAAAGPVRRPVARRRWGGQQHADLAAIERGAERIFVLATDDLLARAVPLTPRGALDAAGHAFMLLVGVRLQGDLAATPPPPS